ncbi:hypothetical protein VTN00DRAFT_417 [Thermoascus crustaceus]|uniref:uncharacterized protein n=1 Tax=Thermoascus crustaceus TaxID=5088 RepID=UPI003743057E
MSQPSAKICADCVRAAWRTSGALTAATRGTRRIHTKEFKRAVHSAGRDCARGPLCHASSGLGSSSQSRSRALQQNQRVRRFATASESVAVEQEQDARKTSSLGPLDEYDRRVQEGRLRDDPFQRALIQHLQDLHDMLRGYTPPKVVHPSVESLNTKPKSSFFGSLFGRSSPPEGPTIPENLPKGLYMYGDVGCGKTMLMDLFYDTLPPNIPSKTRIHFHNFMQDVHKRMHKMKIRYGNDLDVLPLVAADIAESSSVLCFDEFQCTDVADAMILRRLLESLMSHGVVIVTTSNRHPDELYKNGIQRESFIPCIHLLKTVLKVLNLNSNTDYRKIPRPPSGVYHHPLDIAAARHADKWFEFLGDPVNDPPHPAKHEVWGRTIEVPLASGRAARFSFQQLLGRATGAADYLELVKNYDAFIVTDVPQMTLNMRDLARRFITFMDAVYESKAKLVLTTAVPLTQLFLSDAEIKEITRSWSSSNSFKATEAKGETADETADLPADALRNMMGMSMEELKSKDEELFAFARALSRLVEMGSKQWVERGLGMGMNVEQGMEDREAWKKTRSRWSEDNM